MRQELTTADAALRALSTHRAQVVAGCIPFDTHAPTALFEPNRWETFDRGWLEHRGEQALAALDSTSLSAPNRSGLPGEIQYRELPGPDEHLRRVHDAVSKIRAAASVTVASDSEAADTPAPEAMSAEPIALEKVVLARALEMHLPSPVQPMSLLDRMVAQDHHGRGFLSALSAAGERFTGTHMVGSSPEILIERRGNQIFTHPLAGTMRREPDDRQADRNAALSLQNSFKDLDEHRFVVEAIEQTLRPLCSDLDVPPLPTLTHTPHVWHLGTPITGTLKSPTTTALELALALHPTPAVAGTPQAQAIEHIQQVEADRGFYAGAVGWSDASGDGHWRVLLRAAHISDDGSTVIAQAGGGIVADSIAEDELLETYLKLSPVVSALGGQQWLKAHVDAVAAVGRR